jgi:hypothetical protein
MGRSSVERSCVGTGALMGARRLVASLGDGSMTQGRRVGAQRRRQPMATGTAVAGGMIVHKMGEGGSKERASVVRERERGREWGVLLVDTHLRG